jgi:hypothetical protein
MKPSIYRTYFLEMEVSSLAIELNRGLSKVEGLTIDNHSEGDLKTWGGRWKMSKNSSYFHFDSEVATWLVPMPLPSILLIFIQRMCISALRTAAGLQDVHFQSWVNACFGDEYGFFRVHQGSKMSFFSQCGKWPTAMPYPITCHGF